MVLVKFMAMVPQNGVVSPREIDLRRSQGVSTSDRANNRLRIGLARSDLTNQLWPMTGSNLSILKTAQMYLV